jgi:hypothetical protein
VNYWRKNTLNLEPLPTMVGANMANYLKVPFTYCWSPALIPKPFDWPSVAKAGGRVIAYGCLIRKGARREHLDYIYRGLMSHH